MRRLVPLFALATLIGLGLAGPAAGQTGNEPPYACREHRAGVVQCIAGKLCECRFERGGSLSASPSSGWRWDCGTLRPSCGAEDEVPATLRGDNSLSAEDVIPDSLILDLRRGDELEAEEAEEEDAGDAGDAGTP